MFCWINRDSSKEESLTAEQKLNPLTFLCWKNMAGFCPVYTFDNHVNNLKSVSVYYWTYHVFAWPDNCCSTLRKPEKGQGRGGGGKGGGGVAKFAQYSPTGVPKFAAMLNIHNWFNECQIEPDLRGVVIGFQKVIVMLPAFYQSEPLRWW